ncbi:hypothetical protein [Rubritalea tangerina]|uniref:Outer membrane protein beta-barrel domain-containing protein n=1 Tax=Rubritalea tangerina TaxID=430798 RepID=A0ABW4ZE37_9BACT
MKSTKNHLFGALILGAMCTPILAGEDQSKINLEPISEDCWEFSLSPYFMMASLTGDVSPGPNVPSLGVDAAFSDLKDHLEAGAAGYFEARKGKWGFGLDAMWLKLSGSNTFSPDPGSMLTASASLDIEEVRAKALAFYRFNEYDSGSLDFYAGVSYNYVDMSASIAGSGPAGLDGNRGNNKGWFDPVIGVRFIQDINDKWFLKGIAEIGGWASSDTNWELMGVLGYHINHRWDLALAYRGIGIDYKDDGFVYDVTMHGPMIGFTYNW